MTSSRPSNSRTRPGLMLAALGALLVTACSSAGVGVAASNRGAAVGVNVGTPAMESTPRDKWPVLPPPRLVTPEDTQAPARQAPASSPESPAAPKP